MRPFVQAVLSVSLLSMAVGALLLTGCGTWEGLGKDIGKTGDAMAGEGKYVMTVQSPPDKVTAAARKAVEQMKMTEIESSFDEGDGEGEVTAWTSQREKVRIDIEPSGAKDSKVTIHLRGGDADDISKQIQDRIRSNL